MSQVSDYADPRTIALHRIERATMLEKRVEPPDGFSLDGWLKRGALGFGGEGSTRLVVDFYDGAGKHLLESPLSEDQTVEPIGKRNDAVRITATVQNTEQLRWWLLGFAQNVEVIKPAALRKDIAQRTRAAAELYAATPR